MPVEEQLLNDTTMWRYTNDDGRQGQKLTIPNRTVTKLAFLLLHRGTPPGNATFTIRKVSDDDVIVSKIWGLVNDLPLGATWEEVEFDTPATIDEEVRIAVEYTGHTLNNEIGVRYQASDVKATEVYTRWMDPVWQDEVWDCAYKYTWDEPSAGLENKSANMGAKMVAGKLI